MSDDNMLKEEGPAVRESLAWMIADVDPKNAGLPVWLGEQPFTVTS